MVDSCAINIWDSSIDNFYVVKPGKNNTPRAMKNGSAMKLWYRLWGNLRWKKCCHNAMELTAAWRLWSHRYFPDDFQILPSSEITITVTSSWYFLRSPWGISSNSWKSIPAKIESKINHSRCGLYIDSSWKARKFSYKWKSTYCNKYFLVSVSFAALPAPPRQVEKG